MTSQELLDKQRQSLWPNYILYYTEPIALDHGEGLYVWILDRSLAEVHETLGVN